MKQRIWVAFDDLRSIEGWNISCAVLFAVSNRRKRRCIEIVPDEKKLDSLPAERTHLFYFLFRRIDRLEYRPGNLLFAHA